MKNDFEERAGWTEIAAVKMNRIYEINEDTVNRPGPRIVEALEVLASTFHPQLFTGRIIYLPDLIITTNSTLQGVDYDSDRRILDLIVMGEPNTRGEMVVEVDKERLDGAPIVFVNGEEMATQVIDNATAYTVIFGYDHSVNQISIMGVNTIPEFSTALSLMIFISLLTGLLIVKNRQTWKI